MLRLRSRSLPALLAVLPLAIAALAGCTSSSSASTSTAGTSATGGASSQSPAASSTATAGNTATASQAAATSPAATAASASSSAAPATTSASPAAAGSSPATTGREVLLAEGGDVRGPTVYRPGCAAGCGLSGDGTTALFNMTWTTWNATEAVGTGTEKIDDCNPNCAAGTLHAVAVRVTFSNPVMVCQPSSGAWYWTRVTFAWPDGLPAVFAGDNAPTNPFNYSGITAQQATSCS
jgi:hypothetical protein